MNTKIASRSHYLRGLELLRDESVINLFYAALEFRCGVEARLSEYLEGHEHIPKKIKKEWKINGMGKGAERAFQMGDKLARFGYTDKESGEESLVFYYTPVTRELQKKAKMLGDYLHHQKKGFPPEREKKLRKLLGEVSSMLGQACTGTMLGPPLRKEGTDMVSTSIEYLDGREDHLELLKPRREFVANISYPDRFPDPFEKEAYVWRDDP